MLPITETIVNQVFHQGHSNGELFDGMPRTLAHVLSPLSRHLHLADAETWGLVTSMPFICDLSDGESFDGMPRMLAHVLLPLSRHLHLADAETWGSGDINASSL
ncbi:hypothetical protein SLA2020_435810 [Shorea laevis]